MAGIQRREMANGRIVWRLNYRLAGGRHTIGFADEQTANQWKAIFDAAGPAAALDMLTAAGHAEDETPDITVAELVENHIDTLTGIEDGTRGDYRLHAARDITPYLGALPLARLHPPAGEDIIRRWINLLGSDERTQGRPLSPKTIANRHALLSAACDRAVRQQLLPANPCHGIGLPEIYPAEMVFLDHSEWWLLHDACPPLYQPFLHTLVFTGLRFGEATALQAGDIDFSQQLIRVERAWKHNRIARLTGDPKSRAAKRFVPFDDDDAAVLLPLVRKRAGRGSLVFTNRNGDPILNSSFHHRPWPAALEAAAKAGLTKRPRPHDLRHTYAAWMLSDSSVSIYTLSRVMGHDSTEITQKRYGHLLPAAFDALRSASGLAKHRPGNGGGV